MREAKKITPKFSFQLAIHRGLEYMPWDDDVDIGLNVQDEGKVKEGVAWLNQQVSTMFQVYFPK